MGGCDLESRMLVPGRQSHVWKARCWECRTCTFLNNLFKGELGKETPSFFETPTGHSPAAPGCLPRFGGFSSLCFPRRSLFFFFSLTSFLLSHAPPAMSLLLAWVWCRDEGAYSRLPLTYRGTDTDIRIASS
ncbi:hypothetical protein BJX66DRAFT_294452 [Aspergillus keveii]|uniref:Uncharacterized protein n=1 Tax=Aspergillus keveii TaxID=714993 RepID=A0ABR4GK87_9EURO